MEGHQVVSNECLVYWPYRSLRNQKIKVCILTLNPNATKTKSLDSRHYGTEGQQSILRRGQWPCGAMGAAHTSKLSPSASNADRCLAVPSRQVLQVHRASHGMWRPPRNPSDCFLSLLSTVVVKFSPFSVFKRPLLRAVPMSEGVPSSNSSMIQDFWKPLE